MIIKQAPHTIKDSIVWSPHNEQHMGHWSPSVRLQASVSTMWLKLFSSFGFVDFPCFLTCGRNRSWSIKKIYFCLLCWKQEVRVKAFDKPEEIAASSPACNLPVQAGFSATQWHAWNSLVKHASVTRFSLQMDQTSEHLAGSELHCQVELMLPCGSTLWLQKELHAS